jgi:predicted phosphodiesterase
MRVAAFSDTHGNLLGLEAVLADIERHGSFATLLMAGDLVAGGPWPAETLARIRALRCPAVLGNTDRYLFADPITLDLAGVSTKERAMNAWTVAQIGQEGLAYIRSLPFKYHLDGPGGGLLMVHANPENLEDHIAPEEDAATIARRLTTVREPVLVFGHLHIAYQRRVAGKLLVNVASAGFPRDGDRRAAWAEIWHADAAWHARIHRVPYDVAAVVAALRSCPMPNANKRARVLLEARYKDYKE